MIHFQKNAFQGQWAAHVRQNWKPFQLYQMLAKVTIQIVENSNRRKNQSYSKRRKNSIATIIFRS